MAHNFTPKLRQMRIAAMTGIGSCIHDFALDPCGTFAQYDDPTGKEYGLFHVVGYQKRSEARALPQRHELFLHGDARQGVELAQRLVKNEKLRIVYQCACKRGTLRHSSGKLTWIGRSKTRQADQAQNVVYTSPMASK